MPFVLFYHKNPVFVKFYVEFLGAYPHKTSCAHERTAMDTNKKRMKFLCIVFGYPVFPIIGRIDRYLSIAFYVVSSLCSLNGKEIYRWIDNLSILY